MQSFHVKPVTLALLASVLVGMNSTEPTANAKVIVRNKRGRVIRQATSVSLATLINTRGSIQIDDKVFEHWRDFTNLVTGGATPVDPALITVVATGEGTCDPGPGVRIESTQFALTGSAQSQTTMFTYDVRTLTAAPAIDDVTLSVGSANADLAGVIQVTETVRDTNQAVVATLSVQVTGLGTNPPSATDHQVFAAPQSVVTVTKIVQLSNGGPEDTGTASLGEVDQNYSQVCGAAVEVTKQIACLPCVAGIGCEDLLPTAYSGTATGLLSDTASPTFCYSITVTNAGVEALQSITFVDSSGLDFSGCFTNGFALPVGGSTNCFIAAALSGDTTNTVTVTATGANSLTPVTASASATAIVLHATISCPDPISVQCVADVPPPSNVTATLNCGELVNATSGDQIIAGDCPNRFTIQRIYTAQDACSNSVSCVQIITVSDTMPPALTGVPDDLTVQCLGDVPLPASVTATDNCDGAITPVLAETQSNPGSSCSNLITRTWTATDSCGNTASLSQHILVNDTTPPVITACPTNLTVCASAGIPPSDISLVTATDNCGGAVIITVLPDVVNGTCPQVVTRTYLATDACSNQTPCVQTITANCGPACSLAPPNPLPACGSTNNTLSGPGGLATYSWSDTGSSAGWAIIVGADSQTITYSAGSTGVGVFTLVSTDGIGCESTCSVSFACVTGGTGGGCRVTGGSNKQTGSSQQPCITTPPPTFVSHGGQVGAPVGVPTPFTPASVCIRGEWQHTRHLIGNSLVGSFHASGNGQVHQFDSLMCACLPCPGDPGSGGIVGGLCNPGDRICGPEPRSAPANKICFSGVGDYTFSQGQKTVKAVFRVDIEDHGEPGGSSGPRPPDRYRIRLWLLDRTCTRSFDAESEPGIALRQAVACTNPLTEEVSATAGPPDIDDGGDMTQGNHQIHPMTGATCLDEPTETGKPGKSPPRKGR